jgi:5'-deoxynucleotidase YfbR-like HD superfamily hydrolase
VKEIARFVRKLRGLNFVRRWNFHPHIRLENVAEHSYWVAVFTYIIAEPEDRARLVAAALMHDAEEAVTADLPALVKAKTVDWDVVVGHAERELYGTAHPEICLKAPEPLASLWADRENGKHVVIKIADLFAALMYAREEMSMGNKAFDRIHCELMQSVINKARQAQKGVHDRSIRLLEDLGFDTRFACDVPDSMSHL